ncbi:uncharacterized protein [Onthophagus taurus]|uniref:uncharacterized protein n=1 Tax=Onthophagus taurus TaxID=166361 RepID=UPI0039BE75AE
MSSPGATLSAQSQHLVLNLLNYFEAEKRNGGPLINLNEGCQCLANLKKTVQRIKSRAANPVLSTPGKKRPRKKPKTQDLHESNKMAIRDTIYSMYKHKEQVTLGSLKLEIEKSNIVLGKTNLSKVLNDIGFHYKADSNRKALMEKTHIADLRLTFLRKYVENMNSLKRQVVFLDETWIFSKGTCRKSWQDEDVKSIRKPEGYDGKRFIIAHAGSSAGFVQNASLIFSSKSKTGDYHGDMNGNIFIKWIQESLLPNFEKPSLIVMDNASYHSTLLENIPSSAWTKANIAEYLRKNQITFDCNLFKSELAKSYQKEKKYQADEIIKSAGHEVIRLLPYHCEFNAIEMI